MIDIRFVRQNPDAVKTAMTNRGKPQLCAEVDKLLEIDEQRRELSFKADNLKARQNKASKEIPAIKKSGGDATALLAEMKDIAEEIKGLEKEISTLEATQEDILLGLPNIPDSSVPVGKDENDNKEIKVVGTPTEFPYTPLPHWELGASLKMLDPERAAKVTGSRFNFYRGMGARLMRALMTYFLSTHTEHGYEELVPPFIVNADSARGTGQLPKFAEDMFKLEGENYYLIPTAEVPVTNFYRDEILTADELPIYHCAYSPCFRSEVGSAGRDTRGIIRQHQFNKVELVKFCEPEESFNELEKLLADAERILVGLGLPYRVVLLCTGDTGIASAKTYDLEVWMPSYGRYVEISSCSNFTDYQARRAQVRFKKERGDKAQFVHTLNGSGLAIGRTVAAIMENYQNGDGTITVPEVLRPFMGCDKIGVTK